MTSIAEEPLIDLYAKWRSARIEWRAGSDAGGDWDGVEMTALFDQRLEAAGRMVEIGPATAHGLALLLRMMWAEWGPCSTNEEGIRKDLEDGERRAQLAALNAAERLAGLPVTDPYVWLTDEAA